MIQNALIVHGKPSEAKYFSPETLDPSDSHWLPWAKHQLNIKGIPTETPDMPEPHAPDYDAWARKIEGYEITENTVLIGLSAGAGFWLEWMSNNTSRQVERLILVAPWTNPNDKYPNFCKTPIDPTLRERCIGGVTIFHSTNDDEQARRSFSYVTEMLSGVEEVNIPRYGHYMLGNTMQTTEFPELIDSVISGQ